MERPTLSSRELESELNRIAEKPLAKFIDGISKGVEERIFKTELTGIAKEFPCPCCKGAGWLYTASDLFSLDVITGKLEPITRAGGGAVRMGGALECPRCLGAQFDLPAWVESMESQYRAKYQAKGVAA